MRLTESMEKKKKRNIEDTPLFNSYIVRTIIIAVALMGGGISYCSSYCKSVIVILSYC